MKILILTRNIKEEGLSDAVDTYGRSTIDDALSIKKVLEGSHEVKIFQVDENIYNQLKEEKPDVVFNLADDGIGGDITLEPHIPAIMDILKIFYTGNNYFTLALCQNKARAKEILTFHGIGNANFQVFNSVSNKLRADMKFPMIVKPIREDGSVGIKERSVVNDEEQLKEQVEHILNVYNQEALVEEFIDGREFNVAVIGNKRPVALPVAEIDFSGMPENLPKIVSYRAKWVKQSVAFKKTPVICPAQVDEKIAKLIEETAKKCFKIFGCRGYTRIDFRYDEKEGKLYVLEINPNPDISEDAGIVRAAGVLGMSYQDLILKIINFALKKED